ncbi:MAG: ABC transporter permease [Bacteroidaceae bacterium]|nr:ABC transporter permease [Bacteroidaceae bacterium]
MKLVWKLLRQHISIPQFTGFFLANLIGMTIILLGIQFYNDTQAIYNGEDSFMKADYMIINKKVGVLSSITGGNNAFTKGEIEDINGQPFVERVGAFTPSSFGVRASFAMNGLANMSTDMFFESVPNDFIDVAREKWHYAVGDNELPIILPKNYLDLYNFGYAQSRSLPKVSEGILGAIKLQIRITGNGHNDEYVGRIVGFSSRLNTILVPEDFMKWANGYYSDAARTKNATRIILELNNPADDRITTFVQDNNYETDKSKLDASKTTYILRVVVAIVMSVGVLICILSLYILMLSVFLLVQKNSSKLENLLLIGYSPAKVSLPYQLMSVGLNVLVFILAVALLLVARSLYLTLFESFFPDFVEPSILPSLIIGVILLIIVSVLNMIAVRQKVMAIWNKK